MQCPYCGKQQSSVLESRLAEENRAIRRRRVCEFCEKRFTTYERVEGVDLVVIKKNGQSESFNREKIRKGIIKATWKRPIAMSDIDDLIDEVERKLRQKDSTKVKSWEIGNLVMNRLRKLDAVAYLLFASVYKDFQSFEDFEEEVSRLRAGEDTQTNVSESERVEHE
jgi:transcriptional repressor NrdR